MNDTQKDCPICGCSSTCERYFNDGFRSCVIYNCDTCGKYACYAPDERMKVDKNKLAPYLFYNSWIINDQNKYFFVGTKEQFNVAQKELTNAILLTNEEVDIWYPQTFSEKIDKILLGLSEVLDDYGEYIKLPREKALSAFFIKRYCPDDSNTPKEDTTTSLRFIYKYMLDYGLIEKFADGYETIRILPDGFKRIDEFQKNKSNSKNVFVAMSFDENMKNIRSAIRETITKTGYIPRIMDEIEHNNQIVPEMLHEIRQSKFIIAEFTNHNNGAYYEAGYAAGLGKEVIHVCQKGIFGEKGHFDIKQKATILWETEVDLVEKLCKRIEATIV
ncbi:MAG: Lar family restriction alleviation protein [Chitinispirillia bacterium]|nr:Lar family restriction alleviation protein [Chitinispirillia bacterium]